MKREEAEEMIYKQLEVVREIVKKYNPKDGYLTMSIMDGNISFNNSYWEHPGDGEINWSEKLGGSIHI